MIRHATQTNHDSSRAWPCLLADALAVPRSSSWWRWFCFALVSYGILLVVSFGLLWIGDKVNAPGMAVTRMLARIQAPVVALFYPSVQREDIAVLLYDQTFLDDNDIAWPLSYADHADWLLRLVGGASRPKAILVDIAFTQNRKDPTVPALQNALCKIGREYGVPVFLAGIASGNDAQLRIRKGLDADPGDGGAACFTLVGIDYEPDPVDHVAWHYPLTTGRDGAQTTAGAKAPAPGYSSAALAMAKVAGQVDPGPETDQLALVWGYAKMEPAREPGKRPECVRRDSLRGYVGSLFVGFWRYISQASKTGQPAGARQGGVAEDEQSLVCPYHPVLTMSAVSALSDAELAGQIGGRFVILGADIPGYNDRVDSPVSGSIPGAFAHAMALDNLLTFRGNYKLATDWNDPSQHLIAWGFSVVLVVLLVHVAYVWVWFMLRRSKRLAPFFRRIRSFRKTGFWREGVVDAVAWLLGLALQYIFAAVVVGFIQHKTRIGMLPLVELVMMTLTAEALGHVRKIRRRFARFRPGADKNGPVAPLSTGA